MVLTKPKPNEDEEAQGQRQILLNQEAVALLDSWLEDESESPEEQRIALEQVMRGIDEFRGEGQKLFTKYLDASTHRS